ncbi:MAG TPA: hypothetical protein PK095_25430 [Myxococcota bacterium]|nr:hypothetical protein [Myxococcota bacterium]
MSRLLELTREHVREQPRRAGKRPVRERLEDAPALAIVAEAAGLMDKLPAAMAA